MTNSRSFVEIRGLHFARDARIIFDNIHLDIPRGKITAIMGPSGTGKTTLLRLIGAQVPLDKGSILVNGKNLFQLRQKALYEARRNIGMLFQNAALFTSLSVYDNVAFPLRAHTDLSESMLRYLVLMKLEAVGLRGARDLMPNELSGGMARRVALARAIALDPELIMYDEPFAGQDPISMGMLVQLIKQLNEILGLTSVIVSHDVPETIRIADYIYVISDKKIVGRGTPQEMANSEKPEVKQFMQGLPDGVVPFHYPADPYLEDILE